MCSSDLMEIVLKSYKKEYAILITAIISSMLNFSCSDINNQNVKEIDHDFYAELRSTVQMDLNSLSGLLSEQNNTFSNSDALVEVANIYFEDDVKLKYFLSTFNEYKSKSNNDFLDSIFVTGEVAAHFIDIINTANQAFSINDFEIFLEAKFFEIAESDLDHDDIELLLTYITIY